MNWKALGQWIEELLQAIVYGDRNSVTIDHTSFMPQTPPTAPNNALQPLLWDTPDNVRHSIRVICDEEGLTVKQKNELSATVHCESGYKNVVHKNIVNGKVSTTDYGYFQINDYWHIGIGKDFPSTDYVMNTPEAVCRWMCRQWKAGNGRAWVCFSKQLYLHYAA